MNSVQRNDGEFVCFYWGRIELLCYLEIVCENVVMISIELLE